MPFQCKLKITWLANLTNFFKEPALWLILLVVLLISISSISSLIFISFFCYLLCLGSAAYCFSRALRYIIRLLGYLFHIPRIYFKKMTLIFVNFVLWLQFWLRPRGPNRMCFHSHLSLGISFISASWMMLFSLQYFCGFRSACFYLQRTVIKDMHHHRPASGCLLLFNLVH